MMIIGEFTKLIFGLLNVPVFILGHFMKVSYAVGQLIVNSLSYIIFGVFGIFESFLFVMNVLYEDSWVFLYDVWNKVTWLANTIELIIREVLLFLHHYYSVGITILFDVFVVLESFFNVTYVNILKLIHFILSIPELMKRASILIGYGIWYLFHLIPLGILYGAAMLVYLVGRGYFELYSFISYLATSLVQILVNVTCFFIDFPLEAAFGLALLTGTCFVSVKYSSELTNYASQFFNYLHIQMRHFAQHFKNCYTRLKLFVRGNDWERMNIPGNFSNTEALVGSSGSTHHLFKNTLCKTATLVEHQNVDKVYEDDQKLCVVCQDVEKSVCILPCRHLCLCKNCSLVIQREQGLCPICRQPVRQVMNVYL